MLLSGFKSAKTFINQKWIHKTNTSKVMQIIIPMSGLGKRFQNAGYTDIKPLIRVQGKPIIEWVVSMFPGKHDFIFICREEHLANTPLEQELKRIKFSLDISTKF